LQLFATISYLEYRFFKQNQLARPIREKKPKFFLKLKKKIKKKHQRIVQNSAKKHKVAIAILYNKVL